MSRMTRSLICIALLCCTLSVNASFFHSIRIFHYFCKRTLTSVVDGYSAQSHKDFAPYFKKANMPYPPHKLALLVFKKEKLMELWANDGCRWGYITHFQILAASGDAGPKLKAGDRQVPEGLYQITMLNPNSKYDLSLMINYPNDFDRAHAAIDHRDRLGGDIFIHGGHLSVGCVAIGDHAIEDLFVLVYEVGTKNVSVIIAPNDLRNHPAIIPQRHPAWVNALDNSIKSALMKFPANRV